MRYNKIIIIYSILFYSKICFDDEISIYKHHLYLTFKEMDIKDFLINKTLFTYLLNTLVHIF